MNRYLLCSLVLVSFAARALAQGEDESVPGDPPSRLNRSAPQRPAAPRVQREREASPRVASRSEPGPGYLDTAPSFDEYPGDGWDGGAMGGCGPDGCGYGAYPFCRMGGPVYADVDYLMWWTKGMRIPPLVITNPNITGTTPLDFVNSAQNLLDLNPTNGTSQVLYGNQGILQGMRSGGRVRLGMWVGPCGCNAIEGDFFALGDIRERFVATSPGTPALGRPFFDPNPNLPANVPDRYRSELVSLQDNVAGTVAVDSLGRFTAFGARGRRCLVCEDYCCDDWCGCPVEGTRKLDLIAGWRYIKFDEELKVQENLQTLPGNQLGPNGGAVPVGTFQVNDGFETYNNFNGVDVGLIWMTRRGCWSMDLTTKIALGNMHQRAVINGQTTATIAGQPSQTATGGLLAQTTNIGDRSRDVFAAVPEVGLNLGYHWSPCVRLVFGYTFLYASNVVRAGEIIDTQVDSRLLPFAGNNAAGATRPEFRWVNSDFWAQGMNFGVHYDF